MIESTKFYKRCYRIAKVLFRVFYRYKVIGRENINDGGALICVNHSSMLDPIFVGLGLGLNIQPHIIAKKELFKIPIVAWLIRGLDAISVDRSKADIGTIKESLNYLKRGSKVAIFPEGTRVADDDVSFAKLGAIKIAERAGVPILPLFLPRKKRLFRRVFIVFGEPYEIAKQKGKRSHEDYVKLSEEMMEKILSLNPATKVT